MGVQFPWLYCNTPKTNPSPAPSSVSQPVQIPESTDMFMVKSAALVGLTWFKPQFGAVNPLHIDYFRHQLAINLHFSRDFPSPRPGVITEQISRNLEKLDRAKMSLESQARSTC